MSEQDLASYGEQPSTELAPDPKIKAWRGKVKLKQKGARGNAMIPIIILQTPQDLDTEQYHMLKPGKSYFRRESGQGQDWKPLSNLMLIDAKTQTYRVR